MNGARKREKIGWRTGGRDGRGYGGFLSAWEDVRTEADEYHELDGEGVLVLAHYSGRGKTSGLELSQMPTDVAALFHVAGGMVTTPTVLSKNPTATA